ncbi:putative vacuolar h+-atpase assembly protein [Erysiphe necator]|uniref:Putative vacuolar h+-atpase assembly protein n=1 Tax=Uncinula necator TaxID=52586 RepID=A0A0B1P6A5_UNCNE|nr:putative vacuolar h+-atpase assembly protein [Erysiphe necator]
MVLLTITPLIIEAIKISSEIRKNKDYIHKSQNAICVTNSTDQPSFINDGEKQSCDHEAYMIVGEQESLHIIHQPCLTIHEFSEPKVGDPISHKQLIDLSKLMKSQNHESYRLELLLQGSKIYVPPPSPKPEKTPQFKSLMARLRQDEEMRSYREMIGQKLPKDTISQRYQDTLADGAFPSNYSSPTDEIDEVMYADIRRQVTLIFNVLISILACGSAIWTVGRWWSTPTRLALSMSGSILVGLAEIFIFWGYIRRVSEAKAKEQKVKEVKEVLRTWVIQPHEDLDTINGSQESVVVNSRNTLPDTTVRRRK